MSNNKNLRRFDWRLLNYGALRVGSVKCNQNLMQIKPKVFK